MIGEYVALNIDRMELVVNNVRASAVTVNKERLNKEIINVLELGQICMRDALIGGIFPSYYTDKR